MSRLADLWLVVPCFDEAARLDPKAFLALVRDEGPRLVFVDDGSRDATLDVLRRLAEAAPERIEVLSLPKNRGKGEAVRHGMRHALAAGAAFVGYWDADLATPLAEAVDLMGVLRARPELVLVMGSRVNLLGRKVERAPLRHYAGRVFATLASVALGLAVYDTQCGAKIFRAGPWMEGLLASPFASRWAFDVELLARLRAVLAKGDERPIGALVVEHPVQAWRDVPGSKMRWAHLLPMLLELWRVRSHGRDRARVAP